MEMIRKWTESVHVKVALRKNMVEHAQQLQLLSDGGFWPVGYCLMVGSGQSVIVEESVVVVDIPK